MQQALEQQQKLAALKSWNHFSGLDAARFGAIEDAVLYNVMWGMHDGSEETMFLAQPFSPSSAKAAIVQPIDDAPTTAPSTPSSKKPRRSDPDSDSELSDLDEDNVAPLAATADADRVADSQDEDEPEGSDPSLSDNEDVGNKRKRSSAKPSPMSKAQSTSSRSFFGGLTTERKYSLNKIAEKDAGRVMFVFERSAKSAMLDENGRKVYSSREASVAEDGSGAVVV
jgi:hypothetical protein